MTIFLELFLIGVGLAMDAFAVSVCKGLGMQKVSKRQAAVIGLFFGGFQAWMPFLGWLLGCRFQRYIVNVDHWVAFALLALIGGKMIAEAVDVKEEVKIKQCSIELDMKELFILAVATSIDALAVGITFAFLNYPILEAVSLIGIITFIKSVAGVYVGNFFGSKYKSKAEFAGGLILILLGVRILLSHLEVRAFIF